MNQKSLMTYCTALSSSHFLPAGCNFRSFPVPDFRRLTRDKLGSHCLLTTPFGVSPSSISSDDPRYHWVLSLHTRFPYPNLQAPTHIPKLIISRGYIGFSWQVGISSPPGPRPRADQTCRRQSNNRMGGFNQSAEQLVETRRHYFSTNLRTVGSTVVGFWPFGGYVL